MQLPHVQAIKASPSLLMMTANEEHAGLHMFWQP